jgi:chromosome segregation ATPase
MSGGWTTARIVALIALVGMLPASAQARNYGHRNNYNAAARQRMIQAAQAQLSMARRAQAMAQVQMHEAQGKVDSSNQRIRNAKSSMDEAKTEEHNDHLSLQEIQARLIEETGADSDISKAHAALLTAVEEFLAANKRVLHSDEYKAAVAEITDPSERLKKLPEVREAAFQHDDDYQTKLQRVKIEKVAFGQLRTEMVRNSTEWMAMSAQLRESLKAQNHAEIEATNGGSAKMRAKYRLHDAQAVYAAATMTINQCEAILRRLGVKPPPAPVSPPSASGS